MAALTNNSPSPETHDVLIAGAGPIGLFLASELALHSPHLSILMLERSPFPGDPWKSAPLGWRGLNTVSVEALYRRGLLAQCFEQADSMGGKSGGGKQHAGHFAGIMLDKGKMDMGRWRYRIEGPGLVPGPTTVETLERVLTKRAEELGVQILRGVSVSGIEENGDEGVTVHAEGAQLFRGKWLVGCDGGRSIVRKAAGFEFVGTEAKFTGYAVKCAYEDSKGVLKPGFHVTSNGMYIRGFPGVLHLLDFDGAAFDRRQDITREHVQDVLERITGSKDVKITSMELASSFTDRSMQATQYRRGRALLAGDAAHIHPPLGSQGMNLGLGDAMNLGWKLAATLRQETEDLTLLDTYENERQAIGKWVLEWTRAQVVATEPGRYGKAVRTLLRDLIDTTDGTHVLIDRVWGLSQRYNLYDGAHPLVGSSAPDFEFLDGSRLGAKLESGKGILLDFEDREELKELVAVGKYGHQLDYIGQRVQDARGLSALLVRPDGIVAWLVEDGVQSNLSAAVVALEKWFKF